MKGDFMIKRLIFIMILFGNVLYANLIELDFAQFDNYKRTSDMIYRQTRESARNFSYNGTVDLSKLPKEYLLHLSQPALESLEMQREILKHLLKDHSNEIEKNEEIKYEFVRRAIYWEENYNIWNEIRNDN